MSIDQTPSYKRLTCQESVELVSDYLEDNLPIEIKKAFEEHMANCLDCPNYFKQMRQTIAMLYKLKRVPQFSQPREELLQIFRIATE